MRMLSSGAQHLVASSQVSALMGPEPADSRVMKMLDSEASGCPPSRKNNYTAVIATSVAGPELLHSCVFPKTVRCSAVS